MAIPVRLKVFKGDVLVTSRDFERDIIKIGRLASAHLCLEDEKVSRIHAVIEVGADGGLFITDMGSIGGTHVNGRRVSKSRITFGDELQVGGTTLRLENPTEVAARNLASAVESAGPVEPPAPVATSTIPPQAVPVPAVAVPDAPSPVAVPRERRAVPRKARGPLGVGLRFLWGDRDVGEFFVAPGARKSFSVGSAAGVDFVMGDARLGAPRFEVLRTDGKGFTVCFTGRMKGELTRSGDTRDLRAVIESGLAAHEGEAYALALEMDDFLRVELGGVVLEVCFQPVPRPVVARLTDSLDTTLLNIFLVTFFLAGFFVISAANHDADAAGFADELARGQSRIAKLIVKPPEVQKNRLLQQLDAVKKEREVRREASRPREPEPRAEKPLKALPGPLLSTKGSKGKRMDAREVARGLLGGVNTANLFQGPGSSFASALGHVGSTRTSSAGNLGMLGLRSGPGGNGGGETVGLVGNAGLRGRSTGESDYGNGPARVGQKQGVTVGLAAEEPQVSNPLDRDLIRRVIQLNRSQVRYCYESLLNRYPALSGKVAVRFIISAEGSVASSEVSQSTAGNVELEKCVAGRVRGWVFPKLKGGGMVTVTYPFIFKAAGE
ncbi:TonB family protein [Archangium violaceum]|uniref:TonB family protein n=1 Tax=Archangium violaceum TaxID=83451 RepID=UPI00195057BC|nr:TonB family protein [Archangium violaceum]QRN95191.1 TonB family protein [Archangium violaceum]